MSIDSDYQKNKVMLIVSEKYIEMERMKTQSVLIPRSSFSLLKAKDWVQGNGFKIKKIDITSNFFRFRQMQPTHKGFYSMKTLPNGVKLVLQGDK
jgi:hypothetical protein